MKVLVTGGNGFIGSHLVDKLLVEGHDVRCTVRRKSNRQWLDGKQIELLECDDIRDAAFIGRAVRKVEIVFHVLGTLVAPNLDQFRRVNVEPVRLFLDACAGQPLRRFVLVGSQGAAGPNPQGHDRLSEDDPCRPVSAYGRSKLEAEEVTREYQGKVPYTIVRPCAMYGPRDVNFLRVFRSAHVKGWIPQVGRQPKTLSLAHARDIVAGTYQAAVSEKAAGETYFLGSEEAYTSADMGMAIEKALGRAIKQRVLPDVLVKAMMLYADFVSYVFRKHVLLNRDRLSTLSYPRWVCDVSKAHRDLGYRQSIPLTDGFRETYQWYLREGWL